MSQTTQDADLKRINLDTAHVLKQADTARMCEAVTHDLPSNDKALWIYAEQMLMQAAMSSVEAGRALMALKNMLPDGAFIAGLKERGIGQRTAQNLMRLAYRFADRSKSIQKLGRSKMYALLEMTDPQLNALEEGQEVIGMKLDFMDKMTCRELKDRIKKQDQVIENQDHLLSEKNKMIDQAASLQHEAPVDDLLNNIESLGASALIPLAALANTAGNMIKQNDLTAEQYFALQKQVSNIQNQLARATTHMWDMGGRFQAALEMAGSEPIADVLEGDILDIETGGV